jgi:hypothetical protein
MKERKEEAENLLKSKNKTSQMQNEIKENFL